MHVNEQSPPSLPILSKLGGSKKPILNIIPKNFQDDRIKF